jgi:acyl-CoA synthetase (AMP-forming)/AMP-acid ligase II
MFDCSNVSELIRYQAKKHPNKKSIVFPVKKGGIYSYTSYSFLEFENRINQVCNRLVSIGVKPGHKVLFFVKPNLDFCVITFALFRIGATTVFIDPGMKKEYFLNCIEQVKPDVMIAIPLVHCLRRFKSKYFNNIKLFITTSKLNGIGTVSLFKNISNESPEFSIYQNNSNELAAILFTSGGTGAPKGVEYTHDIFINQTRMLKEEFSLSSSDCDVPGFPLFSFFTLAMGMTSVIPDMNPAKPNQCNPENLYRNITESKATFIAGSPAIWERLADYCVKQNLTLPSVKYVVMFGAPVRNELHEKFDSVLTNGTTYTPYGATECLPVANISGSSVLTSTASLTDRGFGTCVGKPLNGVEIKIIKRSEKKLLKMEYTTPLSCGEVGEIIVSSPNVTKGYYQMPDKTQEAKIYDGDKLWHRMGDVGHLDEDGKLWFCGRSKHVVLNRNTNYYPINVESIYNKHPEVRRTALIGLGKTNEPAIVIELYNHSHRNNEKLIKELRLLAKDYTHTSGINKFFFKDKFPVDVRHNIKIDRTLLGKEFSEQL